MSAPRPPQIIISPSAQICCVAGSRLWHIPPAPVAVQLSVLGWYLPPLAVYEGDPNKLPPQITIFAHQSRLRCVLGRSRWCVSRTLVIVQLSGGRILDLAPVDKALGPLPPAPDDHLATGPHCRVMMDRAAGALVVLVAAQLSVAGVISPAECSSSVKTVASAPDDHLSSGPHCCVSIPSGGCAQDAW